MPIPEPVVLVWYLSDIRFKYITFTFGDREPLTARGFKKIVSHLKFSESMSSFLMLVLLLVKLVSLRSLVNLLKLLV